MLKRFIALLFAGMFLVGAAACGDDDGNGSDGASNETTDGATDDAGDDGATDGDSSDDGGSSSGNDAVEAYCESAENLATELEAAGTDPAALAELTPQLTELQETSQALAAEAEDLDESDADRLRECTEALTDAANSMTAN